MTNEPSPRPWHTANFVNGIEDANNGKVAANIRDADAKLIVDAVNDRAKFEEAHMKYPDLRPVIIAAGQRDAAIAERDRLRDIVKRLADKLEAHRGIFTGAGVYSQTAQEETSKLLREARAAIAEPARNCVEGCETLRLVKKALGEEDGDHA